MFNESSTLIDRALVWDLGHTGFSFYCELVSGLYDELHQLIPRTRTGDLTALPLRKPQDSDSSTSCGSFQNILSIILGVQIVKDIGSKLGHLLLSLGSCQGFGDLAILGS